MPWGSTPAAGHGVLVGPTLPGRVRVAEEHGDPGREGEAGVLGNHIAFVGDSSSLSHPDPAGALASQRPGRLDPQLSAGLAVQRLVTGLMRYPHVPIIGVLDLEPCGDLLRRPPRIEPIVDSLKQPGACLHPPPPRTARTGAGRNVGGHRPVLTTAAMTSQLAVHHRRMATQDPWRSPARTTRQQHLERCPPVSTTTTTHHAARQHPDQVNRAPWRIVHTGDRPPSPVC